MYTMKYSLGARKVPFSPFLRLRWLLFMFVWFQTPRDYVHTLKEYLRTAKYFAKIVQN